MMKMMMVCSGNDTGRRVWHDTRGVQTDFNAAVTSRLFTHMVTFSIWT
jgi:hypothetical protein